MISFKGIPIFVCAKAPTDELWSQPRGQTVCMFCGQPIADHDDNGLTPAAVSQREVVAIVEPTAPSAKVVHTFPPLTERPKVF
jgi:hypothetical protein